MTQPTVELTTDHTQVATLWLNRPDKHNAFDDAMIAELTQACEQVAGNPRIAGADPGIKRAQFFRWRRPGLDAAHGRIYL